MPWSIVRFIVEDTVGGDRPRLEELGTMWAVGPMLSAAHCSYSDLPFYKGHQNLLYLEYVLKLLAT